MSIEDTLKERGGQHGLFADNARVTTELLRVVNSSKNHGKLSAVQAVALYMILHKIARVMSGDPNHVDHWHDIAGYAKLAEDDAGSVARESVKPKDETCWMCKCGEVKSNPPEFNCLACKGSRKTHEIHMQKPKYARCPVCHYEIPEPAPGGRCPECNVNLMKPCASKNINVNSK